MKTFAFQTKLSTVEKLKMDRLSGNPPGENSTPQPQLNFRLATQEDATWLQQHIQSSFRAQDTVREEWTASAVLNEGFTLTPDAVTGWFSSGVGIIIAADPTTSQPVGSVNVGKKNGNAHIFMLAVVPERQRDGVGKVLLEYAERWCASEWKVHKVGLNTLNTRHNLIKWYKRRGYKETGEVSPFPYHFFEGIDLPKDLGFVEMEKEVKVDGNGQ